VLSAPACVIVAATLAAVVPAGGSVTSPSITCGKRNVHRVLAPRSAHTSIEGWVWVWVQGVRDVVKGNEDEVVASLFIGSSRLNQTDIRITATVQPNGEVECSRKDARCLSVVNGDVQSCVCPG